MTLDALVPLLRCPDCESALGFEPVAQRDAEAGACGLLRCPCAVYPVLDGVPVLQRGALARRSIADGRVLAPGVGVDDVSALVRDGRGLDALAHVLSAPVCPWPLNRVGPLRRLSLAGPLREAGLRARRQRTRAMLRRRDRLTAQDWMASFYWHAPEVYDPFNYFFFRFGTPRHLATLGLLSALSSTGRPVLDLACGYGHFAHTLAGQGRAVVGLDQNAHQAWVARHYVAPGAAFVCADADRPLPFRDGALGAAYCSDAFHYFGDKAGALAEVERATAAGPVVLATVGNRLVGDPDGDELAPAEYAALLDGRPWAVRTEGDLLRRYLDGRGPDLSSSSDPADVAGAKWLSYAVAGSGGDALLRDHPAFDGWPHVVGEVAVNPLYVRDGDLYRLRMPSPWYEAENGALRDYMPAWLHPGEAPRDPLARAAVIGLPARYARADGHPRVLDADRALTSVVRRLRAVLGS